MKPMHAITPNRIRAGIGLGLVGVLAAGGCTSESVRVALETQRRADEVQQAVFDRQHEALGRLLYRDLSQRLTSSGLELSAAQHEALNAVWNDRDLVEFWAVQYERAKALRIIGVDLKLFSDQSIVDLLWKGLEARADRAKAALATRAVEQLAAPIDSAPGNVEE